MVSLKQARAIKEWIKNSGDTKIPTRYGTNAGNEEAAFLADKYWQIKTKIKFNLNEQDQLKNMNL